MIYRFFWYLLYLPIRILWPTRMINKFKLRKKGRAIVICTHLSNADPFILGSHIFRSQKYVMKKELNKNAFSYFLRKFGGIPIDRDNFSLESLKTVIGVLNNEEQLVIFPEGTRNKLDENSISEVKNGVAMFALKGNSDIIPLVTYKKPRLFRMNYILIGDAIKIADYNISKKSKENINNLSEAIQETLGGLKEELKKIRSDKEYRKEFKEKSKQEKKVLKAEIKADKKEARRKKKERKLRKREAKRLERLKRN